MNKKILIVEDEKSLLNILVDKFAQEGFVVSTATNGKDGLEAALAGHPDLILLDIIMPVMDGMTMLDELRKDPWGKSVQIILLTNLSNDDKVTLSDRHGVVDYLIKSDLSMDEIVGKVKRKIGLKK